MILCNASTSADIIVLLVQVQNPEMQLFNISCRIQSVVLGFRLLGCMLCIPIVQIIYCTWDIDRSAVQGVRVKCMAQRISASSYQTGTGDTILAIPYWSYHTCDNIQVIPYQ